VLDKKLLMGYDASKMNGRIGCAALMGEPQQSGHSRTSPKPFRIRTCAKCSRNPFRIRTSKTKDLKSFRIRTYEKMGEGALR
jgi:hypothetical protein